MSGAKARVSGAKVRVSGVEVRVSGAKARVSGARARRRAGNGALDFGLLDGFVGFQLHKARNRAATALHHMIAPELLPGHFPILYLIDHNPGCSQSAVARAVGLDRSSLVPILTRFERRGWITRDASTQDGRAYALALTGAGRKKLDKVFKQVSTLEKRIANGLGDGGQRQMLRLLHRFQAAFDGE